MLVINIFINAKIILEEGQTSIHDKPRAYDDDDRRK